MIDAVLSYHTNPYTCGVAKFNHRLAKELGVPCLPIRGASLTRPAYPLFSVKASEFVYWTTHVNSYPSRALFLHDAPDLTPAVVAAIYASSPVYAANGDIARHLRRVKPDIVEAWCPSTVEGDASRGDIHVLTFGMAHKLTLPYYEKLKSLLDDTPGTYTVGLSCAVHEGHPWDRAMQDAEDSLRRVFGVHLRVLGYLGDDALVREIDQATAVAAFYDPAFRANNTSAWAVLERGRPLITNVDDASPCSGAQDIQALSKWPEWPRIGPERIPDLRPWEKLIQTLQDQPCAK